MFHNILVALDGSPSADKALAHAIDLASSEHAKLTLFTAIVPPPVGAYYGAAGDAVTTIINDAKDAAEAIVQRGRDRVPDDVSVTTLVSMEPVPSALIGQIEGGGHDLVVMGSRGRGAVRSALLGSTSHYVLNHSHVPVLIIHPEQASAESEPRAEAEAAA